MEEYYGWIFVEEKLPPKDLEVLVAYVDDGEVEYLIAKYGSRTVITSRFEQWFLPEYYKQSCVRAWRMLPPFVVERGV